MLVHLFLAEITPHSMDRMYFHFVQTIVLQTIRFYSIAATTLLLNTFFGQETPCVTEQGSDCMQCLPDRDLSLGPYFVNLSEIMPHV